jgi:murein DD-endopeptidase MepM/ murein hydrolase activator NlpD
LKKRPKHAVPNRRPFTSVCWVVKRSLKSTSLSTVFIASFCLGLTGFIISGGQNASVANANQISSISELRNFTPNLDQKKISVDSMNHTVEEFLKTWPTQGQVSAVFGEKGTMWFSGVHTGLDIANNSGTIVSAAHSGVVTFIGEDSYYGKLIRIDNVQSNTASIYAHLDKILTSENSYVHAGNNIGTMGNSGNSTGTHLHFELIQNGKLIDPLTWLPSDN